MSEYKEYPIILKDEFEQVFQQIQRDNAEEDMRVFHEKVQEFVNSLVKTLPGVHIQEINPMLVGMQTFGGGVYCLALNNEIYSIQKNQKHVEWEFKGFANFQ